MGTDLDALRDAVTRCTDCELHADATHAVFGAGPASAWLMLVGEQPGDREDREGAPFVGPAGRLLDTALERAGVDRDEVYVTNVVKHFRFEREGKRRVHKTPAVRHVRACRHWFDDELAVVGPRVVVTLGATAAKALVGPDVRISEERGEVREWQGRSLVPTIHPSAILRGSPEARDAALDAFVADLGVAAGLRS